MNQVKRQIESQKPSDYLSIDPGEIGMADYEIFVKRNINLYDYAIFQGEEYQNPRKKAALNGEIGMLLKDFAYITFNINKYSETITRVTKFLSNNLRKLQIDIERERTTMEIRVKYSSESSLFKITSDMKFMDLLINVARYWSIEYTEFVLIDNLFNMWPYDSNVMNEQISYKLNPTNFLGEDIVIILFEIEKLRKKYLNLETDNGPAIVDDDKMDIEGPSEIAYRKDFVEERLEYEKSIGEIAEQIASFILKQIIVAAGEDYNEGTQKRLENKVVEFLGLFVYLLFIVLFIVSSQYRHKYFITFSHTKAFQKNFLEREFRLSNAESKNFYMLNNRIDVLDYLQHVLQIYYQDKHYNGKNFTNQELYTFNDFYFLLGKSRIRQKRVSPYSCTAIKGVSGLGAANYKCYDLYTKASEDKSEMNMVLLDFWYNYTSSELQTFNYNSYSGTDRFTKGFLADFDMSGYISYIEKNQNWNSNMNAKNLEFFKLYSDKFWDVRTRALILELNYYVPNTDFTVTAELLFEQLPSGAIKTIARIVPFRLFANFKSIDALRNIFESVQFVLIVLIVLAMFPGIFVRKIRRHGVKAILKAACRIAILPWSIMTFLVFGLALVRQVIHKKYDAMPLVQTFDFFSPDYKDLIIVANQYEEMLLVDGLYGMFGIFLIFKFFSRSKGINIFWVTLSKGRRIFLWYLTIFLIMYLGYVFIAYFFYGQFLFKYSTVGRSFESLINGPVGIFDYYEIWRIDTITAPVFFVSFIFPMFFMLNRIFLAMFLERYEIIQKTFRNIKEHDQLFEILGGGSICFKAIVIFPLKIVLSIFTYPMKKLYLKYISKKTFKKVQKEALRKDKKKAEREKITRWMKDGDIEIKGKYTTADVLDEEERIEKERQKALKQKNVVIEEDSEEESSDED